MKVSFVKNNENSMLYDERSKKMFKLHGMRNIYGKYVRAFSIDNTKSICIQCKFFSSCNKCNSFREMSIYAIHGIKYVIHMIIIIMIVKLTHNKDRKKERKKENVFKNIYIERVSFSYLFISKAILKRGRNL